ncbi:Trk system potassium transporter TrkA [Desulfitobacterium sp.]|uniref:Trk system potassium transporter TrkA n=1 Tax=Desulfitobacterium sp. TaxID=49981 RepID=UPI002B1EE350|nr:Trk system potassium transporter TrkA [Desulfitobacterium sp.]MEA4902951.1 Trk system potassium transporter TrkA [Desulfitobacterium sp.]
MRVVIVGAGKVGYILAQYLSQENHEVIVIENNEERRSIVQNSLDVMTIAGNGASPAMLLDSEIRKADLMVAVTDSDEVNMIACMSAKQAGIKRTIARVRNQEYAEKDKLKFNESLGIDLTINPEMVTALEISRILLTPAALDVEDFADGHVRMLEVKIPPDSKLANVSLSKLDLPRQILIAGILRQNSMLIPHGKDMLLPHDSVFFVGEYSAIMKLEKHFPLRKSKVDRVMIIGAGRIGRHLAVMLEKSGISVKVVDKDRERCQDLAEILKDGLVLCGEGTDIDLLASEGVGESDAVICLTDDDKLNLLIALIAKHLGAPKTFVRVGRSEYTSLMEQVGVDVVLSPRILTAGVILRQVRRSDIVSISLLEGAKAEAMEIIVASSSPVAHRKLKEAKLPRNCLIGNIVRNNEIIIPNGDTYLEPGDRVIVFALPDTVPTVVKLFENRLGSK